MSIDYSTDELVLIAAYLNERGLRALTDGHEFCQRLAEEIDRSPASVERQARNLVYVGRKDARDQNVGANAYKVGVNYVLYHQRSYKRANEITDDENLDLPLLG